MQTLRVALNFNDHIHSLEINEIHSLHQAEISEIEDRLPRQYEANLQQALQEMREEIKMSFEQKMEDLQAAANRNSYNVEELLDARTRIDSMNGRISELESTNAELIARNQDLEQLQEKERTRHKSDIANMEAELQRLRNAMVQQLQAYSHSRDMEGLSDLEIEAYYKLLGGEDVLSKKECFSTSSEKDEMGMTECDPKLV
ncbi:lamin Dm0-like [Musca autumnalis]|uniref:lamin Dm0-like n=1 Tax=Musca autumnalis TaxID=221902 RepID=UPI003CEAD6A8